VGAVPKRARQTSVCILRIEAEPDRLLITMTIEQSLSQGAAIASHPKILHFAQPEAAIDAVADFIRSHQPHGPPS
jgi:hypothetical protein